MRWYEIEQRISGATDWTPRPERVLEGTGDIVLPDLEAGATYEFRVRTVDDTDGAASAWQLLDPYVAARPPGDPPAPSSISLADDDCLVWEMPVQVEDLAGFEVRHAPGDEDHWGRSERAHDGLVGSPPYGLCGVPRGRRTLLVTAVDRDGNRSAAPARVVVDRGPMDDAAEFTIWARDEAALGWPGLKQGALVSGGALFAAPGSAAWLSDLEPAWSVAENVPAWTSPSALAWGGLRGSAALGWRGEPAETRWATPRCWVEYTWSVTVTTDEASPTATLSLDVVTTAPGWRVEYRRRHGAAAWSPNPADPAWTSDTAAAWSDPATAFRRWPGRLVGLAAGVYEFRLLIPAGWRAASVTRIVTRLSEPRREVIVSPLNTPATTTRATFSPPFRQLVHVDAVHVGQDVAHRSRVVATNRTKGPVIGTSNGLSPIDDPAVSVRLIGYGRAE